MELVKTTINDVAYTMKIIDMAKKHLKEQGIDQWQTGYPDLECITNDAEYGKGYFIKENCETFGYLCIDFDGEEAYNNINGKWLCEEKYVVVHRLAMCDSSRGKRLSSNIFGLVESLASRNGINYIRIDTDEANHKMQHIFKKNGYSYRGKVYYGDIEKVAFDKLL